MVDVLVVSMRGADGIALSHDGLHWLAGAGAYGKGWGDVGRGVSVEAGGTLYIRYFSETPADRLLAYATHGAKWGSWITTGPKLGPGVGDTPANPVVLKFSKVGTSGSTVTWMNGSGLWSAPSSPGAYDLALHGESMWTLPPLVITARPESWWRGFLAALWSDEPTPTGARASSVSVPDAGGTGMLLALALAGLVPLWRVRINRRLRGEKHPRYTSG